MSFTLRPELAKRRWPPRGGWIYHETATGWIAPTPMQDNFENTVEKIRRHREANPGYNLSTDHQEIAAALMDQTAHRILTECPEHAKEWILPTTDEEKKNCSPPGRRSSSDDPVVPAARKAGSVERLLSRIRGISRGASTLAAWIGDGAVPVAEFIANHRADICAACPNNRPAADFADRLTTSIAESIRGQTIVKNALDLRTSTEDRLGMCDVCGCPLRLKVWVPMVHILGNTTAEEMASFPEHCWILQNEN